MDCHEVEDRISLKEAGDHWSSWCVWGRFRSQRGSRSCCSASWLLVRCADGHDQSWWRQRNGGLWQCCCCWKLCRLSMMKRRFCLWWCCLGRYCWCEEGEAVAVVDGVDCRVEIAFHCGVAALPLVANGWRFVGEGSAVQPFSR